MKPIAICQNKKIYDHDFLWTPRFIKYCEDHNIPFDVLDCYRSDVVNVLRRFSALVWHYQNYVISDLLEARNVIQVADNLGLVTFPSPIMNWHFDDKIAEKYAFESVNAPIPDSWVFYHESDCINWLVEKAHFPLVAKLRCGSGSNNVKLLPDKDSAVKYARRMFSGGFDPAPTFLYKAYSKLQSAKDISTILRRIKKIPQFLITRSHAKMMGNEKGYCYFQDYIPNDGYDLKVVVVGDKMTFCARKIRKSDFRASGGGDIYYERALLTDEIVDTAFRVADDLKMSCVGFDFVVDNESNTAKILEMCYGFDYELQCDLGAYLDRSHVWHEQPLYVPDEIIKMVIAKVENKE